MKTTRWATGALACAALMCVSATAWAESPINGIAEVKFGGYQPMIDSEFNGATPFATYYSNDLWFVETEWDLYVFEWVGKAGIGFHAGYASVTGDIRSADGASGDDVPGETSFSVIPLRASLVYRYDYSAIHHGIPLVPVFKAGLDYHLWWITDGSGETATSDGLVGEGAKTGWHASMGLNLLLDVIAPSTAAVFDKDWGVNNTYLFAELMMQRVDGFGGQGFDLSDDQLLFGIAFEF